MNTGIALFIFVVIVALALVVMAWVFATKNEDKQKLEDSALPTDDKL